VTDWDKELAKIDKQLASISDDQLLASSAPARTAPGAAMGATKSLPAGRAAMPTAATGTSWVAWAKVLIAVGAAAGLMVWPWPARCGLPLVGFTAATGGVALLGLWSAVGTWRHRLGLAHVASLLVTAWGIALGAREVLPRVGYAIPTAERAASWSCEGLPPAPATTPPGDPNATPSVVPNAAPDATPVTPAPTAGGTTL
jgi:hypothetical protein